MRYYERIDGSKYRNIWVVGDLHGCYTNLMKKLETIGFDTKKDLLISVGDLVDRGTENVECLELITFPWFRAVRGNHEQMMIDGLSERGNVNHWLLNGGGWFFNLDYDKEILAKALAHKADELPLIIELVSKDKKYVICHADYLNRPGFPGECFICELRLPDHRFRWKHNKLFLLLPEEYGPAFPAIVDCYTSPPT